MDKKKALKNAFILFGTYFVIGLIILIIISNVPKKTFSAQPDNLDLFEAIHKGDSISYRFTVKNFYTYKDADLTGYTVKFYVKKNRSDTTYVVNKTCTLQTQSGSTKGKCYCVLSTDDTTYENGDDEGDELTIKTYWAYLVVYDPDDANYKETLFESKWVLTYPS